MAGKSPNILCICTVLADLTHGILQWFADALYKQVGSTFICQPTVE